MKKIAIIGLGLMGGSMAKALKKTGKYKLVGFDISNDTLSLAQKGSFVDEIWNGKEKLDSDITVVALSPSLTIEFIKEKINLLKEGSILTDICGVKESICDFAEKISEQYKINYVGGHPMAGRELSGFANSVENLFINRSYILTKTDKTNEKALEELSEMAYDLGCSDITITNPQKHDKMIAYTSQLPHILAGAYVKSPASDEHKGFSAGSYHDVSRVASVDENLWSELFLQNKENLLEEIDILLKNITEYKEAILSEDKQRILKAVKEGRLLKERDIIKNGEEKPHKFG